MPELISVEIKNSVDSVSKKYFLDLRSKQYLLKKDKIKLLKDKIASGHKHVSE